SGPEFAMATTEAAEAWLVLAAWQEDHEYIAESATSVEQAQKYAADSPRQALKDRVKPWLPLAESRKWQYEYNVRLVAAVAKWPDHPYLNGQLARAILDTRSDLDAALGPAAKSDDPQMMA